MAIPPVMTEADRARAMEIWAEYQRTHDVTGRKGQAVGIDPASGKIWFGTDSKDILLQKRAVGDTGPVYVLTVGFDYYQRKEGKRYYPAS
jgi:hypothetical protein